MDLQLVGKRAIVTGASRGLGFAIADHLAAEGVDVALVARDEQALAHAAEGIHQHGHKVVTCSADTQDDASVRSMVAAVVDQLGGVDILVNAAARPSPPGPSPAIADLTDDALRVEIETKVLGYLRCIRAVAPLMVAQRWGRIVNISGINARLTGSLVGSVRNVAVAAMTKNIADELGRSGITANVVHPGVTVTDSTPQALAERAVREGRGPAEVEAELGAATSIGRLVTATEVANVVAFLASPLSSALTGNPIVAAGGIRGAIYY